MNYRPRLDGLRCVAIMMVLLEHFVYIIGSKVSGGFYGVNLFFVLSGFLITSILLNDRSTDFKSAYTKFLGRRVLRIFPIYYLVLLFLLLINAEGIVDNISYLLSYTYNYKIGITNNWQTIYSPYWSLSVEEQFYVFFPIIILLLKRNYRLLYASIILLILLGYLQMFFNVFQLNRFNYVGLPTNMSYLSLGALGALLVKNDILPDRFFKNKPVEFVLLLILFFALISNNWNLKIVVCPLVSLYLIIKASSFSFRLKFLDSFFLNRYVIHIGKISYGIYLYHLIVSYLFTTYLFDPIWLKIPFDDFGILSKLQYNAWIIKFPIVTFLVIIIAGLSFKYIETPIIKLKDRFFRYSAA